MKARQRFYVGIRSCGCVIATLVDDLELVSVKEVALFRQEMETAGNTVEYRPLTRGEFNATFSPCPHQIAEAEQKAGILTRDDQTPEGLCRIAVLDEHSPMRRMEVCDRLAPWAVTQNVADTLLMLANVEVEPSPVVRIHAAKALNISRDRRIADILDRLGHARRELSDEVIRACLSVAAQVRANIEALPHGTGWNTLRSRA